MAADSIGTDVGPEPASSASGVVTTGAQLGTASGMAALVLAALVLVAGAIGETPVPGTAVAWALAAAAAAVSAAWLSRRPGLH